MLELKEGKMLYHGSYCEVQHPLLEKCAKHKDFGKCFYLTSSKSQAVKFLNISIIKALSSGLINDMQNYGYVSVFQVEDIEDLLVKAFRDADQEWLHCVAAHRKRKLFPDIVKKMADYDIVVGKIADDATNATLTAYLSGVFGEAGEEKTDEFCISILLPNKLKDQYCFKTEKALKALRFVGCEKICMKKPYPRID